MNKYIAELTGTFALVFAGCGAIVVDAQSGGLLGHTGVSMVFGLVVMAMIYSVGNISGAHINPAVTIAFWLAGRFAGRLALPYVVSQFAGALLAAVLLRLLFPDSESLGATLPAGTVTSALLMEVVLSFLLMFVILNVSTGHMEKGVMAGVAIGGTVAFEALVGGPVSGASMNPARSLGPALVSGQLQQIWIYLVGPMAGMALATPACRLVQGPDCCSQVAEDDTAQPANS